MGTTYSIIVIDDIEKKYSELFLKNKIDSILIDINNIFSTYLDSSEINNINKSISDTIYISKHFRNVLDKSIEIYKNTSKLFDPTVKPLVDLWNFGRSKNTFKPPSKYKISNILINVGLDKIKLNNNYFIKKTKVSLDFNAIAKGYAVDIIAIYLNQTGYKNHMIEIGGEVKCSGNNNNSMWSIGIQNPFVEDDYFDIINLENKSIATSGTYRNFHVYNDTIYNHIINPLVGFPIKHNTISVSVIAKNCLIADAYATGLLVMGAKKGLEFVNKNDDIEAVFIIGSKEKYSVEFSKNYNAFKR